MRKEGSQVRLSWGIKGLLFWGMTLPPCPLCAEVAKLGHTPTHKGFCPLLSRGVLFYLALGISQVCHVNIAQQGHKMKGNLKEFPATPVETGLEGVYNHLTTKLCSFVLNTKRNWPFRYTIVLAETRDWFTQLQMKDYLVRNFNTLLLFSISFIRYLCIFIKNMT